MSAQRTIDADTVVGFSAIANFVFHFEIHEFRWWRGGNGNHMYDAWLVSADKAEPIADKIEEISEDL